MEFSWGTIYKTVFTGGGVCIAYLFGGWSALLGILLAFVVIDYVTGVLAAALNGKLSSNVGLRGIAKKVFIFTMVAVAHLADKAIGTQLIMSAAIFFYLANELLSIIENSGQIGLPVPPAITQAVAILKGKSEVKPDEVIRE